MQSLVRLLERARNLCASLWKGIPKGTPNQGQAGQGPKKKAPGHRYKEYDHSDEKAHQTAEQYNWRRQNILTFFTTLFALGAVVFAYKTFVQTRRQANIAEAALATSDRPWLDAKYVDHGSLAFNPDGSAQIPLIFALENGGRSPATSVFVEVDVIPAGDTDVGYNIIDRQKVVCKQADTRPLKMGAIIFPNRGTHFLYSSLYRNKRLTGPPRSKISSPRFRL